MPERKLNDLHPWCPTHDPRDRLRAASITWMRQGDCPKCGKSALTGYLDGKPIARACTECGLTESISSTPGGHSE